MNPIAMTAILVAALAAFSWSAFRRWNLLRVGTNVNRFDDSRRAAPRDVEYAFNREMDYYSPAGIASQAHLHGVSRPPPQPDALGRAFYPRGTSSSSGRRSRSRGYEFIKDVVATCPRGSASSSTTASSSRRSG